MPPTKQDEKPRDHASIFEVRESQPIAVFPGHTDISTLGRLDQMDTLLSTIKWVFLFVPGATAIHVSVMITSLSVMTGTWPEDTVPELLGSLILFSFLVLFGLGRLTDFRYFKVIAAIISSAIFSTVIVHILASFFIGYENFGWSMLATLPLTLGFAHIIKRRLDEDRPV